MSLKALVALDLSGPVGSVALYRFSDESPPELIEQRQWSGDHHAEAWLVVLRELLTQHKWESSQVAQLVGTVGPGSFTGLRIALASLKALAQAWDVPLTTVRATEARWIAFQGTGPCTVLTSLGSQKVGFTPYGWDQNGQDSAVPWEELPQDCPGPVLIDDRIDTAKLPPLWREKVFLHPLRANHLVTALRTAKSARTHRGEAALVGLSPEYLGSSFKPISGAG